MPKKLAASKISRKIVNEYIKVLEQSEFFSEILFVMVLGSFGRYEANRDSDMDIWLICKNEAIFNLSRLSSIALSEKKLRTNLGKKYNYPNLDRHLASIFSQEEALLYKSIFHTRVDNPKNIGEILQINFVDNLNSKRSHLIRLSDSQKVADLIQSQNEFVENWNKAKDRNLPKNMSKKWLRRILQEMEYYITGTRLKTHSLDKRILEKYHNDNNAIFDDVSFFINKYIEKINKNEITESKLLHSLMWTLEKVRWEIILSQNNVQYFNSWRLGEKRCYGFSPREIGNLVLETTFNQSVFSKHTKELSDCLISLTRNLEDLTTLNRLNQSLSKWISDSSMILISKKNSDKEIDKVIFPTTINNTNTISKIYPVSESRFAKSESSSLSLINSKSLVNINKNNHCYLITQNDIFSKKLDIAELDKYLPLYAKVVRQIHQNQVPYFGRLSWDHPHKFYSDYLISRVNGLKIKDNRINKILSLISNNRKLLDSEKSFLCHMDPGPRNIIVTPNGKLSLIDFEHASGCSATWDVERVLFQIPSSYHEKFISYYASELDQTILVITRIVMIFCFAHKLINKNRSKKLCLNYIDRILKCAKMTEFPRLVLMNNEK